MTKFQTNYQSISQQPPHITSFIFKLARGVQDHTSQTTTSPASNLLVAAVALYVSAKVQFCHLHLSSFELHQYQPSLFQFILSKFQPVFADFSVNFVYFGSPLTAVTRRTHLLQSYRTKRGCHQLMTG